MKKKALVLSLTFIALLLFLLKIQVVLVRVDGKETVFIRYVRDGDLIEIGHVNSIYDREVKELLKVEKGNMELVDVITDSFGIKEYYRIDDEPTKGRKWRAISFLNSPERNFFLKINGKLVDIKKYEGRSLCVEIGEWNLISAMCDTVQSFTRHVLRRIG